MSFNTLKDKLAALNKQAQKATTTPTSQTQYWKPGQRLDDKGNPLTDLIRILPNQYSNDPEFPFLELPIYWAKKFGKTWISPVYFGKPDPVVDYCNNLFDGSFMEKDKYFQKKDIKKALMPETRYYALILDRNAEHEGPKWWSFGVEVFREIGELMLNDDYGAIHDLKTGRDLTVKYTPAVGQNRPKTSVMPKPNVTLATSDPETLQKIKDTANVVDSFVCPSEKELDEALQNYTNVEPTKPVSSSPNVRPQDLNTNSGFEIEQRPKPDSTPPITDLDELFKDLDNQLKVAAAITTAFDGVR